MVPWPRGEAEVCKTFYNGSNPFGTSNTFMAKKNLLIFYWIIFLGLFGICFMPWAHYSDIQSTFTGFYTYENIYGKPALLLLITTCLNGTLLFSSTLTARYVSLGSGSIFFAYGIRTFYLYSSCHNGICPSVKIGLWLMMIAVMGLFTLSLFGKVKQKKSTI